MKKAILAVALACLSAGGIAQDKAAKPSPPYLVSGGHHYLVGVTWNEEAAKLLPAGLKITPERSGSINLITDAA